MKRTPLIQHPAGHVVLDHREVGRQLMLEVGVDPDAPLEIDWERMPDLRDNRDPERVYAEMKNTKAMFDNPESVPVKACFNTSFHSPHKWVEDWYGGGYFWCLGK